MVFTDRGVIASRESLDPRGDTELFAELSGSRTELIRAKAGEIIEQGACAELRIGYQQAEPATQKGALIALKGAPRISPTAGEFTVETGDRIEKSRGAADIPADQSK